MKFIVLGSGCSVPHSKRTSSAYWVEAQKTKILLDCSASSISRMAQENLDWHDLDSIWISHFHLDHFGGIMPFLFGTKWAPQTQGRKKQLRIFGPQGLEKKLRDFDSAGEYDLFNQPFPLEIIEIEPLKEFEISEQLKAVAFKTPHTQESLAISLCDSSGKRIVFTSDTGFDNALGDFAHGADLFVLECSFLQNKPVELHLELRESMFLIRYAKPKKALLTHFYPEWDSVDFEGEIDKFSPPCQVIEAKDSLRLEV
ncbi:MAG: MBL fold metallo-hydrolase [Acidobacteria bacterium]|jgi:ribonuclease BN (tRNA processing enzyme)|nr:MAG: MBL fold metallo-hydrolase [Acidobacteriota bacterium]GIU81640.1 MAG: arylsulfatase [Pyrinomonadaceae bacterium]